MLLNNKCVRIGLIKEIKLNNRIAYLHNIISKHHSYFFKEEVHGLHNKRPTKSSSIVLLWTRFLKFNSTSGRYVMVCVGRSNLSENVDLEANSEVYGAPESGDCNKVVWTKSWLRVEKIKNHNILLLRLLDGLLKMYQVLVHYIFL